MTSAEVTVCKLGILCFSFQFAWSCEPFFRSIINTCWPHHVVSWHWGVSGLQETWAALRAEGIYLYTDQHIMLHPDRLPARKLAKCRDANDVGVLASWAQHIWVCFWPPSHVSLVNICLPPKSLRVLPLPVDSFITTERLWSSRSGS